MMLQSNEYEMLSSRKSFNKALKHFKGVMSIIQDFEGFNNLADIINELIAGKVIEPLQVEPIVQALLVDKYHYAVESSNLQITLEDFSSVVDGVKNWNALDLMLKYHHPELGVVCVNPRNKDHWESVRSLRKNELIILYCGNFHDSFDPALASSMMKAFIQLVHGKTPKNIEQFKGKPRRSKKREVLVEEPKKETAKAKTPAQERNVPKQLFTEKSKAATPVQSSESAPVATRQAEPSVAKKMTPLYGVPVTNELFHNGNVEAWKRIIDSYKMKNPSLDVYVFYDGERIHNLNTLFKWGKVKHGSMIMFAIAGEAIKDVAKLQRYLKEGASPRFENFLRSPVNKVLELF